MDVPNAVRRVRGFVYRRLGRLSLPVRFCILDMNAASILEPFVLLCDLRVTNQGLLST